MEIKSIKIEDLKPSEYNPRGMTEKERRDLTESILRFGMVEPIVVNGAENRKNVIIGGHQRFYICRDLGWKEMPCVFVFIADIEKEKELNLRLNRSLGHWDWDLLAKIDENLLVGVGFDEIDIKRILNVPDYKEKEIDLKNLGIKNKCPKCGYEW